VTSVTANLTHSSDACHLHLVALRAANEGIPIATIHDCYGGAAPNARRLNEILREQFVHLHKNHNWLEQVLLSSKHDLPKSAHAELPELPKIESLVIEGVLQSFFAFK